MKLAWTVVIAVLALILIFSSIRIVGAGQKGVVTRFGEIQNQSLNEGIHLVLPFGIDQVWKQEVRIQKFESDADAASKDLQEVGATLAVNYRLQDDEVVDIYRNLGPYYRQRIIEPAIQETFKAVAAQFDAAELLQKRPEVKSNSLKLLKERLEKHNIDVVDINIVNFNFSKEFDRAIEDKQVAQQEAERAGFRLETAKLEAEAIKVQAEALAQNEQLVDWEAVKKWNGILPKVTGGATPFIDINTID